MGIVRANSRFGRQKPSTERGETEQGLARRITRGGDVLSEAILRWCADSPANPRPDPKFERFLDALVLEAESQGGKSLASRF